MKDAFLQKFEQHVAGLFEAVRAKAEAAGEKYACTPLTDELFSVRHEAVLPYLERQVCRALAHRQSFRETAPHWSPELPLSSAEYEKMIGSKSCQIAVVGFFGRSLATANWGTHLNFRDYVCGLMACEYTPPCIRLDVELRLEFPPREIIGFDRNLCWGSHERIYEIMQQLMREEEIWSRCGMADEAKEMRGAIVQLLRTDGLLSSQLHPKIGIFLDFQPDRRN
jgi:hypothetical protein